MKYNKTRILFICKERNAAYTPSFGLINSCKFIANALKDYGIESKVVGVVDNNCIDKEVHSFKPTHVFVEALWVVPEKFNVLCKLYPKVKWYVRVHSKIPFIANEGVAIEWMRGYAEVAKKHKNLQNSANSVDIVDAFKHAFDIEVAYHPNIYSPPDYKHSDGPNTKDDVIDIGCFGAIRPMKNQLIQALAAVSFGNEIGKKIRFHMNGNRVEMKGESTFKNIQNVFKGTKHELVAHDWSEHHDFIKLVRKMDVGMQVSMSETFNIVAADFVWNNIPVVGSNEISWLSSLYQASITDIHDMIFKLKVAYYGKKVQLQKINKWNLDYYNEDAIKTWISEL